MLYSNFSVKDMIVCRNIEFILSRLIAILFYFLKAGVSCYVFLTLINAIGKPDPYIADDYLISGLLSCLGYQSGC